jgi:hypothetical protein
MKTLSMEVQRSALVIIFGKYLEIPERVTAKFWRILQQEQRNNAYVRAVLYALRRPVSPDADVYESAVACMTGPLAPAKLLPYVESLVERGLLTRCEGSAIEECVLDKTNHVGEWREW